jgi:hypothetical protein
MFQLKHIIDTYGSRVKYLLFGILILVMLLAIRTYINYITIIDTTDAVRKRSAWVQNEMEYSKNFQTKYLSSEYGHLFLAHDNNALFRGESIINFKTGTGAEEVAKTISLSHIPDRQEIEEEHINLSPPEAWQTFIKERISE